jgi:hypothetical protein
MSDLISKRELYYKISETYKKGRLSWGANEIFKDIIGECDSVENKGEWIPITTRPMTEEEKTCYQNEYGGKILNCPLPDNGQEVLISFNGNVYIDTFWNDDCNYFEDFDINEVDAWQPLPEPYKAERG